MLCPKIGGKRSKIFSTCSRSTLSRRLSHAACARSTVERRPNITQIRLDRTAKSIEATHAMHLIRFARFFSTSLAWSTGSHPFRQNLPRYSCRREANANNKISTPPISPSLPASRCCDPASATQKNAYNGEHDTDASYFAGFCSFFGFGVSRTSLLCRVRSLHNVVPRYKTSDEETGNTRTVLASCSRKVTKTIPPKTVLPFGGLFWCVFCRLGQSGVT